MMVKIITNQNLYEFKTLSSAILVCSHVYADFKIHTGGVGYSYEYVYW